MFAPFSRRATRQKSSGLVQAALKKGAEDTWASVWSKFNGDFIHTSSPLNAHDDAHTVKRRGNLPHGVRKKNMSVREECAENPSV